MCYSPLGDVIAVGLGNSSKDIVHAKNGAFVILNEEDLSVVHEAKDSNTQIVMIAYSPEGETLAVAAEDGPIYLYAVNDEYELIGRCIRHSTPVCHIDFSVDGEWLRTNGLNGELLFFNADDASVQTNASTMRDMKWVSSTCIYSWHNKSIHDNNLAGEIVTTACVSKTVLEVDNSSSGSGEPIAENSLYNCNVVGTNLGFICFHPYPCIPTDSEYHRTVAHVGEISRIRFLNDSIHFLSCGKHDRCLLQWKCVPNDPPVLHSPDEVEGEKMVEAPAVEYVESDDYGLEMRGGSDIEEDFMVKDCGLVPGILTNDYGKNKAVASSTTEDGFSLSEQKGDAEIHVGAPQESMQVWLESVVEPTNPPQQQKAPPDVTLELQYIHGYRCQDMRNNVRYTAKDDIAFVAATVGVVMDRLSRAQNYFFVSVKDRCADLLNTALLCRVIINQYPLTPAHEMDCM